MLMRRIKWLVRMIVEGHFRILFIDAATRIYRGFYSIRFRRRLSNIKPATNSFEVRTAHPIAYESPDHLVPWGTMNDNSSNRKFVLFMADKIKSGSASNKQCGYMDLGCSGGQLVKDFMDLGWRSVGLEGSDFSLKHNRANWPSLGKKNLFTADITKPFTVLENREQARFHLITAWEVLEHIPEPDLHGLFRNILNHMEEGAYFVGSTTAASDVHDGMELHQTKLSNREWKAWFEKNFPELEAVELPLKYYQYVRFNYGEQSFLSYRKRNRV